MRKNRLDFAGLSINAITKSPPMWYYFMENNVNHIPEHHQLRKTCDEPSCIIHHVLCSKKWSKQTDKGGHDVQFTDGDRELIQKRLLESMEGSELKSDPNPFMKSPCREWMKFCNHGYGTISYNRRTFGTHVIAYLCQTKTNVIPSGMVVRHLCGNPKCLRYDHLRLGTYSENANDSKIHGTAKVGVNHSLSSIKDEKIILEIYNSKGTMTTQQRADKYDITNDDVVYKIDSGASYNSITNHVKIPKQKKKSPIIKSDFEKIRELIRIKQMTYPAHRLSYIGFHNQLPQNIKGLVVRHKCKLKTCVNPDHLEIGTPKQNAADRQRDGTQKTTNAKITQEIADRIRESTGIGTKRQRAEQFGVTKGIISNIDNNRTWKQQKTIP